MQKRIAVLGGGASGVVAAMHAARAGGAVDLIETESALGGLHRSVECAGFTFDIGAFLFWGPHELVTAFPRIRHLWADVTAHNVRVTPQGSFDRYPLSLPCYLKDNGILLTGYGILDFLVSRIRYRKPATMREFAAFHMGRSVYRRSGLAHYVERLYGFADSEVALEFATQRMAVMKTYTPMAFLRKWIRRRLRIVTKSPSAQSLARPLGGFHALYGEIAHELETAGVRLHLRCRPRRITAHASGFELETDQFENHFDFIVSTIPVPAALQLAGLEPKGTYETMDLTSLFFRGRVIPPGNIFYNFSQSGMWKRLTVSSRLYGLNRGEDYFTVEVTGRPRRPTDEVTADFQKHAAEIGLVSKSVLVGSAFTPSAYPVFKVNRTAGIQADIRQLEAFGIRLSGRQGRFEYLTSDAAGGQGRRLAESICKPEGD